MDLILDSIVLDGLAEIDEGRGGSLAKRGLRTDEVDKIGDG